MAYKAVVVALSDDGILFAKRADSPIEADHIIFDDLLRVMDDFETSITLETDRDGYGEWIVSATDKNGREICYKVCFDDDQEKKGETDESE